MPQNSPDDCDLPLTDPFPEYLVCPQCGEQEVEVWCYQTEVTCHQCGHVFPHTPPPCYGQREICRMAEKKRIGDLPNP